MSFVGPTPTFFCTTLTAAALSCNRHAKENSFVTLLEVHCRLLPQGCCFSCMWSMHVPTSALVTVMAMIGITIPMFDVREEREKDFVSSRLGCLSIRTPCPFSHHTCSKKHSNHVSRIFKSVRSVAALPSLHAVDVLEYQQGKVDRFYGRGLGSLNVLLEYYLKDGGLPDRMLLSHMQAWFLPPVFRSRLLCFVKKMCATGGRMLTEASIAPYGLHCFSLYFVDSTYIASSPAENFKIPTFKFEHPIDLLLTFFEWWTLKTYQLNCVREHWYDWMRDTMKFGLFRKLSWSMRFSTVSLPFLNCLYYALLYWRSKTIHFHR